MNTYKIYCFSFNNPERKAQMTCRFNLEQLNFEFVTPVADHDPRIDRPSLPQNIRRNCAIMWSHLDMLREFLNSENEFGIFCEDDIYLHKNLANHLPKVIQDAQQLNLDVLLLSYLIHFKVDPIFVDFTLKPGMENINNDTIKYEYWDFPDDVWGTQMYMLSRNHAKNLIDKCTEEYIDSTYVNKELRPFIADFIFTKEGNRALIKPLLAIEDNSTIYDDKLQHVYHRDSFICHYKMNTFII